MFGMKISRFVPLFGKLRLLDILEVLELLSRMLTLLLLEVLEKHTFIKISVWALQIPYSLLQRA